MKKAVDSILNGLIPSITNNISVAAQAARDGVSTLLEPGAGIINNNGEISQNPNAFGFAFEHLQAIGFNIKAGLQNSDSRAYQIPIDGTKYGADIYVVDAIGKVVAEIQAKAGSSEYVKRQVESGHYSGDILTNAENAHLKGTTITINIDGVESFPVNQDFAVWVAQNPYTAANLIYSAATVGEIGGAGIQGAALNASIKVLLQSIKVVGAYCRGETELANQEIEQFLQVALQSLSSGFIRGAAIKIIQKLCSGNAFAALGFTVTAEVFPALLQVLDNKITISEAIESVGARTFTSGVVTTLVLLFPPIGAALLSVAVIQGIWEELTPEWKNYLLKVVQTTIQAPQQGIKAGTQYLQKNPWDLLGSTSTSSEASSAEMQSLQNELDILLE